MENFSIQPKYILIAVITVLIIGLFVVLQQSNKGSINSFEECKKAGHAIMESYPEQCAANGQTFVNPDQASSLPY